MSGTITTDELWAALEQAEQTTVERIRTEGYLTVRQIMERTGRGRTAIENRLLQLKHECRIMLLFVEETNIKNCIHWIPAYRISPRKGQDEQIVAGVGPLGSLEAFQNGRPGGPVPYGFELDSDGLRLQENPDEQAAIVRMVDWRGRGWSYRQIAKSLETQGIPAKRGRRWPHSTIRKILTRVSAE